MMTWSDFCHNFIEITGKKASSKAIWLKPNLNRLPLPIQRFDEPLFPLSKSIVEATSESIDVYIFDLASYLVTGASGIVALERAIAYTKEQAITILHGPFSGCGYSNLTDIVSLNVDAFTVTSASDLNYYLTHPPYTAFLWGDTIVEEGGVMNTQSLILYHDKEVIQKLEVVDTESLLIDLTDNYIQSIKLNLNN